jgi:hypothetical protein
LEIHLEQIPEEPLSEHDNNIIAVDFDDSSAFIEKHRKIFVESSDILGKFKRSLLLFSKAFLSGCNSLSGSSFLFSFPQWCEAKKAEKMENLEKLYRSIVDIQMDNLLVKVDKYLFYSREVEIWSLV